MISPCRELTPTSLSRAATSAPDNADTDNEDSYKSFYSWSFQMKHWLVLVDGIGRWPMPPTRQNQPHKLDQYKATTTSLHSEI